MYKHCPTGPLSQIYVRNLGQASEDSNDGLTQLGYHNRVYGG